MSKYGNRKVKTRAGDVFDSKKEAMRYAELLLLEKGGIIRDLRRQVVFELIPAQYEQCEEVYKKGPRKGHLKQGKLIEKACTYVADFTYINTFMGEYIVEDVKGMRTDTYIVKRKLMLWKHGIRVKEV